VPRPVPDAGRMASFEQHRNAESDQEYRDTATFDATVPPRRTGEMPTQSLDRASMADMARAALGVVRPSAPLGGTPPAAGDPDPERQRYDRRCLLSRWVYLVLVSLTTAAGVERMWTVLRVDGMTGLEWSLLGVFTVLFAWIALSFWLACFGAYALLRGVRLDGLERPGAAPSCPPSGAPRTAIVVPIYNEDVVRVFAGLTATCASLRDAGGSGEFAIYVLSDTTDRSIQAAEERQWRTLRESMGESFPIYYRHRADNTGRKTGNIADFLKNWGEMYSYMVVLDADSLMTGETLRELVRLMDANPRAGLIQTPPTLIGRRSLFGRIQQFASSAYGPIYSSGLAYLQGCDGNYWGHNAIIRVAPFMRHCGLPVLSGRPPFGGEILSHDFVEAALLRRAGWEIWLVPDLGGSYEEGPPTIADHLARDRRWFQGNLQHLRLILTRGLRLPSRLHLAVGIMSYLSSPLWLLLIVLSAAEAYIVGLTEQVSYIGSRPLLTWPVMQVEAIAALISAMVVLLFGPKALAGLVLMRTPGLMRRHGGFRKLTESVLWESLFSILYAPVAMFSHTRFVIDILLGRATTWNSQNRGDRAVPLRAVASDCALHTVFGATGTVIVCLIIPDAAWWLSPIAAGLLLAIPLASLSSSAGLGLKTRDRRLFLVPGEMGDDPVIAGLRSLLDRDAEERELARAQGPDTGAGVAHPLADTGR